jgi:capsular exopolysaccharide synthesis family protein
VRRRGPLVALCILLAGAAAFLLSRTQQKMYTANASIVFQNPQLNQQAAGLAPTASANPQADADTNLRLATLPRIAKATAAALSVSAATVTDAVAVTQESDTQLAAIDATAASPTLAARIANEYAQQVIAYRAMAYRAYYANALRAISLQLRALSPAQQQSPQGLDLRDRATSLQILAKLQSNDVQVAQVASIPGSPSSPRVYRNTLLGLVLGLCFGIAAAFGMERFDRRLRTPADLESVYELPLIGAVPESQALRQSARGSRKLPERELEVFGLLRAHLRYFNIDRSLRIVVIISAAPADGKSTVARNLALAAARAGERVLYLEADLRRPSAASAFGVDTGPGLSEVLINQLPLEDAVQTLSLEQASGKALSLDVLVAGRVLPPNPAQVTESRVMQSLLEHAKDVYDLVIVDTPPMSVVADAFPLLRVADGALIVGRVGKSRREVAARLRASLVTANAPLVGVVANGLQDRGRGGYGYSYSYTSSKDQSSLAEPPSGSDSPAERVSVEMDEGAVGTHAAATQPTGRDDAAQLAVAVEDGGAASPPWVTDSGASGSRTPGSERSTPMKSLLRRRARDRERRSP